MRFDFKEGDKVILMAVKDIKQMVNNWTHRWRQEVGIGICPGKMEEMCDGKTVRKIDEISGSGNLYIHPFYFPPVIAIPTTNRPEKPKIRLIRR